MAFDLKIRVSGIASNWKRRTVIVGTFPFVAMIVVPVVMLATMIVHCAAAILFLAGAIIVSPFVFVAEMVKHWMVLVRTARQQW